jgi:hypothetical protein
METVRKLFLAGLMLFAVQYSFSQVSQSIQQLEDYSKNNTPAGYSPKLSHFTLTPGGNLHYLFPIYHAFKDEEKFRKIYSDKGYEEALSQYFAFAGDYLGSLQYLIKSYDPVDDDTRGKVFRIVDGFKDIVHADARRYIHFRARTSRVVMINEAENKSLHRAFTLSLLADLYKEGFRYLAMEMLDNHPDHSLSRLTMHTGYFCAEPVAGELVREALSLGYTLVSYEDTAAYRHTPNQRDSIQAMNIYRVLQQDTAARILVHAEYAHISKVKGADGFVPMGLAFKNLSGINPLTIDQTDMSDESNFGYGRVLYQAYLQKYPLTAASIAMIDNEPVNVTNNDLYDVAIIHPVTKYKDGRPDWLGLGGMRQPVYIKPTANNCFLVQAYYLSEIENNENRPWQLVPADQTYIPAARKNYLLYLKKGKYMVYFRDINYHISGSLNIEVD